MKKTTIAAAVLMMVLMFTGCGSAFSTSDSVSSEVTSAQTEPEITSAAEETAEAKPAAETSDTGEITAETDELYDFIVSELEQFHQTFTYNAYAESPEIDNAFFTLDDIRPDIFWVNNWSYTMYEDHVDITVGYIDDYSEDDLRRMYNELTARADEIVSMIPEDSTDYQKALSAHDIIIDSTVYDFEGAAMSSTGICATAYGCLVNGSAICQGYSEAYTFILNRLGIRSGICSGIADGESHAWNYVEINNEDYWVDITWDDPQSSSESEQQIIHDYFLINDEILYRSHELGNDNLFVPECSSMAENYYVVNGDYLESYDFDSVAEIIRKYKDTGRADIMFADWESYEAAVNDLFGEDRIWDIADELEFGDNIYYQNNDHNYVLTVVFR